MAYEYFFGKLSLKKDEFFDYVKGEKKITISKDYLDNLFDGNLD